VVAAERVAFLLGLWSLGSGAPEGFSGGLWAATGPAPHSRFKSRPPSSGGLRRSRPCGMPVVRLGVLVVWIRVIVCVWLAS
jgi:hypothetical protein